MDRRNYRKRCGWCMALGPELEMVRVRGPILIDAHGGTVPGGWWHKQCATAFLKASTHGESLPPREAGLTAAHS